MLKNFYAQKWQLIALSAAIASASVSTAAFAGPGSHKTFNVQSFGATGNGTTDDTAAIQSALTAAANTGAQVVFPSGTYLISSGLNASGVALVGSNATLLANASFVSVTITGSSASITGLAFTGTTGGAGSGAIIANNAPGISITNNTIGANIQTAIFVENTTGGNVTSNTMTSISGVGGNGIEILGSTGITINKNVISGSNTTGTAGGIFETACQNNIIQQNAITWTSFTGNLVQLIGTSACTSTQITKNTLNGGSYGVFSFVDTTPTINYNVVSNSALAGILSRQNTNDTISNNNLTNLTNDAIRTNASNGTTVTTNSIDGAGANGIQSANGGNIAITNNAIANCGLTTAIKGVVFVNDTSATAITITGNQYKGNVTGVTNFIDVLQSFATVTGNKTNSLLPTKVGP